MRILKSQVEKIGKKLGVDFNVVSVATLHAGMKVELEHGRRCSLTNVTNDDLELTAKIALAHLMEFIDYYEELEKMEEKLKNRWKGKKKPHIFKN